MSNQADPGPAQVGEARLGDEDPNSAHKGQEGFLGHIARHLELYA